jgi:DNA-binding transcriptional LysR family regulator
MRTEELETFLWIARLGGVGAAASRMNLTQPAITRRIRELEHQIGAKLFYRSGRGVRLTSVGQTCAVLAERIVADIATFKQASNSDAPVLATVRMGVAETIALTWLDRLLVRIEKNYPVAQVDFEIDLTTNLAEKLKRGTIDIAFVAGTPTVQDTNRISLGSTSLRWMCKPGLFDPAKIITPKHLANLPIFTLSREAHAYSTAIDWFNQGQVVPQRLSHCNSLTVITSLLKKRGGVSLLPEHLLRDHIKAKTLVALKERPRIMPVEYSAIYRPIASLPILSHIAELASEESSIHRKKTR